MLFGKLLTGALLCAGLAASSQAAVMWSTPSGTAPGGAFTYTGGGSDGGLFGDPTVSSNGFTFFPSDFEATASNGSAQTTSDRLFVTLNVPSSSQISRVRFTELGDYTILGTGSVSVTGLLTLTNLSNGNYYYDTLDVLPGNVINSGNGAYTGVFDVVLPAGVTSVKLVLNNNLQATSGAGGTSFIEKKVLGTGNGGGIQVEVITPEPATLATLGLSGLLLLARRRSA